MRYNVLLRFLIIDRDMKKKDLIELCDISKYTITRMNNGENISVETVAKIVFPLFLV